MSSFFKTSTSDTFASSLSIAEFNHGWAILGILIRMPPQLQPAELLLQDFHVRYLRELIVDCTDDAFPLGFNLRGRLSREVLRLNKGLPEGGRRRPHGSGYVLHRR